MEILVGLGDLFADCTCYEKLRYSTKESTWGTLLTMGLRNPAPFIESFEAAARAEGIDLDVTDDRIQMLQEAIDANCTTIIPDE